MPSLRRPEVWLALVALGVYLITREHTPAFRYDHLVWQADAFLHGRAAIEYPAAGNEYFQDVMPVGPDRALLPFPPLPALLLTPFVALFGLSTDARLLAALLAALDVLLAGRLVRRVAGGERAVEIAAIVFFAFGTGAWYAAAIGTTWFLAHLVALAFGLVALERAVALDPDAFLAGEQLPFGSLLARVRAGVIATCGAGISPAAFGLGLAYGLAADARLTAILGAVFFAFVGARGAGRRAISAALGASIPIAALLTYNVLTAGAPFHPAYDYLRGAEYVPVGSGLWASWFPALAALDYRGAGLVDLRLVAQNALIAFAWLPRVDPACGPWALFDVTCPFIVPDPVGTGLLLASPASFLALLTLRSIRRSRAVAGAWAAIAITLFALLAHFSQGWVQWGWRFGLDVAPFVLLLVTLVLRELRGAARERAFALVGLTVALNAWGVWWGVTLGW